jgi:hypothetical protein
MINKYGERVVYTEHSPCSSCHQPAPWPLRHRQFKRRRRRARSCRWLCERCATALLAEVAHNEDVLLFAGI